MATRSRRRASRARSTTSSATRARASVRSSISRGTGGTSASCTATGRRSATSSCATRSRAREASPLPLGVLVAATAGWIGYMIQQSIENALRRAGSDARGRHASSRRCRSRRRSRAAATRRSSSGRRSRRSAPRSCGAKGTSVKLDGTGNLRRVVGSPVPQAIHELRVIKQLVERGTLVIACGGGGAPIYDDRAEGLGRDRRGGRQGSRGGGAGARPRRRLLLILTDVDAVYADWGTPQQRPLRRLTVDEAEAMDRAGAFGEGSMAPKVRAAIDFVRRTGGRAIITVLESRPRRGARRGRNDHHSGERREHPRISGEGDPARATACRSRRARSRPRPTQAEAIATKHRRHGGGEGAGARRRPRQGRRREARQDARRRRSENASKILGMQIKGLTVEKVLVTAAADIAQRGVRRHHPRPRDEEAGVHGEPGRRHRHRGGRGEDAREDPQAARSTRATGCSRTRRCELGFFLYRRRRRRRAPPRRSCSSSTRRS